jgi:hypothetical protein
MPEKKDPKKIACIRRYKKASKKGELTDDAKAFIYRWRLLLPFVMYSKFMLVTIPRILYEKVQRTLIERVHGPDGDAMFTHNSFRDIDPEDFAKNNSGRSPRREGEIFSLSHFQTRNVLVPHINGKRVATCVDWMLAVSPFKPIKITTLLVTAKEKILSHRNSTRHPDWILYVHAFDCVTPDGKSLVELSKGRHAFHFYRERDAIQLMDQVIPDVS